MTQEEDKTKNTDLQGKIIDIYKKLPEFLEKAENIEELLKQVNAGNVSKFVPSQIGKLLGKHPKEINETFCNLGWQVEITKGKFKPTYKGLDFCYYRKMVKGQYKGEIFVESWNQAAVDTLQKVS